MWNSRFWPSVVALQLSAAALPAADFFVDTTADAHDLVPNGICDATGGGVCTLRAAIEEAEAQSADDAIWLPTGTFLLPLGPLPDLGASGDVGQLSITGKGHSATRLRGCGATRQAEVGGLECRLMTLDPQAWLLLRSLSIESFRTQIQGGAVENAGGSLTVERCAVTDNSATFAGGSFSTEPGYLIVRETAFAHGTAQAGGEIFVSGGTFSCDDCIFEGASTGSGGAGGAIYLNASAAWIEGSLFADNEALHGGALFSESSVVKIVNSTFVGNRADLSGGAIYQLGAGLNVYSSTITGNYADYDLDGSGEGGGVFTTGSGNAVFNSILSGNTGSLTLQPGGNTLAWPQDCAGDLISNGHNIVRAFFTGCPAGDIGCCSISGATSAADPLLGALAYHGGSTGTKPISPGSPAIDAGDPAGCTDGEGGLLTSDQRGAIRPAGGACDLGAFEYGSLIFDDDFELWEWKWSAAP